MPPNAIEEVLVKLKLFDVRHCEVFDAKNEVDGFG
jgi:hypothetical protein